MSLNISKFVISKAVTDPGIECQAQSEVTSPTAPVARTLTASQREKPLLPSSPACLSVCLSVHVEQLRTLWTDFHKIS